MQEGRTADILVMTATGLHISTRDFLSGLFLRKFLRCRMLNDLLPGSLHYLRVTPTCFGMDRLAALVRRRQEKAMYRYPLSLFCGRRTDHIKGLGGKGMDGSCCTRDCPKAVSNAVRKKCVLTPQQFRWLMEGLTIAPKKSVRPVEPPEYMG